MGGGGSIVLYYMQSCQNKIRLILYQKLWIEKYLLRKIKNNFPQMYKNNIACNICKVQVCSQQHLLRKHVNVPDDVEYRDLFSWILSKQWNIYYEQENFKVQKNSHWLSWYYS